MWYSCIRDQMEIELVFPLYHNSDNQQILFHHSKFYYQRLYMKDMMGCLLSELGTFQLVFQMDSQHQIINPQLPLQRLVLQDTSLKSQALHLPTASLLAIHCVRRQPCSVERLPLV